MQTHHPAANGIRGLRPVTPALLQAEETARRWRGLPEGASKSQLLQLLEDTPPAAMGVSKGARNYAHWLVKMQPAPCFARTAELATANLLRQGLALVSTYPDAYVSAALDVSTRTLARWRAELAQAGWIAFRDAPDRARSRQGPADAPEEAYGVDLRPLIVRYDDLSRLRQERRDEVKELLSLRKGLSARKNRLRGLLALVCPSDPAEVVAMIELLHRQTRTKTPERYLEVQDLADELIDRLEGMVSAQADSLSRVTEASPAPVKTGAQLNPTAPEADSFYEERDLYAARPAAPIVPDQVADDDEEEVEWVSADYEPAEPSKVIELQPERARRERRPSGPRISCPHPKAILAALPALLRRQGLLFVRHPAFPDDAQLATAYGQAAAHRLGLTQGRIIALSLRFGPVPFAVAALLSESTQGVDKRRAYLEGLIARMDDERIRVDLWASWQRLARELGV